MKEATLTPGNVLLNTFLLGGPGSANTANFKAKSASPEELADVARQVLTFVPAKAAANDLPKNRDNSH